jgi:tRNA1(Val) A37 N6-methylase TrmN6
MTEKLRPPRVFLGGPFSAALSPDKAGTFRFHDLTLREWIEAAIKAVQSTGVELMNSHLTDGWGEIDFGGGYAQRDVGWVEACDIYVALLPEDGEGHPYRSDGTFTEIGCAIAGGKDVVLLMDRPDNPAWSFFVRDLAKSPLVRVAAINALIENPGELLFDGLLNAEKQHARKQITDVRLWNWFQKHAIEPLSVFVGWAELLVYPGVMNPRFSHSPDFLLSFWKIPAGCRVLDMGCGCGVNGINALLAGAGDMLAVDLNPAAVKNTHENLCRNGLAGRGRAVLSDVFSAVTGKFDVILFNPPYHDGEAHVEMVERASFDTPGHGFLRAVLQKLGDYLSSNGRCFIAYADQGNLSLLSKLLQDNGLRTESLHVMRPDHPGFHVRVGWEISKI